MKLDKKKIGAIVLGGSILSAGALSTMAASTTTDNSGRNGGYIHNMMGKGHKDKKDRKSMHANMQKINDAIIAGDYATFKTLASTTPLANISQIVFTSLQAPSVAEKQARESIKSILTTAGVTMPMHGNR